MFKISLKNRFSTKKIAIVLFAIFSAFSITVAHYFYTGDDDLLHFIILEKISQFVKPDSTQVDSNELYINVAYDKELVPVKDEHNFDKGVTDITDREKLLQLLTRLKETNQYKYILLDVRFEKGLSTDKDSALFATIKSMPRIVVSHHRDMEMADSSIAEKTARSDYTADYDLSQFTRLELIQDGQITTPLRIFLNITNKKETYRKFGFFEVLLIDHKLYELKPFIQFKSQFQKKLNEGGVKNHNGQSYQYNYQYYEMGEDILKKYNTEDFAIFTKNKFIIIGDIVEDMHDTYIGQQPGCYILMRATKWLLQGKPIESLPGILAMMLVYFVLICALFGTKPMWQYVPVIKNVKNGVIQFLLSLMQYTIILYICATIMYMACGKVYNMLIPIVYFTVVSTIVENFDTIKETAIYKKVLAIVQRRSTND